MLPIEVTTTTSKATAADKKLLVKKYKNRGPRGMDFSDTSYVAIGRLLNSGFIEVFNRWPFFDITDDGDEAVANILHPPRRLKWEKRDAGIWVAEKTYNYGLVERVDPKRFVWKTGRILSPGNYDVTRDGEATSERAAKKAASEHLRGLS